MVQEIWVNPVNGANQSEAGILAAKFDLSSLRLITGGVDKTLKIWSSETQQE